MSGWNLGPYKQWIDATDWLDQKQPETVRSNETLKAQIIQKGQKLWKWAGCMMANARPSAVSTMELAFAVLALVVMGDAKDGLHELSHRNHRITWTFTVVEFDMDNSYQFINLFGCNFNCPFYIQQLSLLRYGKCAFGLSWLLGDQRGEQELAEDRWKTATMQECLGWEEGALWCDPSEHRNTMTWWFLRRFADVVSICFMSFVTVSWLFFWQYDCKIHSMSHEMKQEKQWHSSRPFYVHDFWIHAVPGAQGTLKTE